MHCISTNSYITGSFLHVFFFLKQSSNRLIIISAFLQLPSLLLYLQDCQGRYGLCKYFEIQVNKSCHSLFRPPEKELSSKSALPVSPLAHNIAILSCHKMWYSHDYNIKRKIQNLHNIEADTIFWNQCQWPSYFEMKNNFWFDLKPNFGYQSYD